MSYQALHDRSKRIGDLEHAAAMLAWDEAAMMPHGGGKARAEAMATLAGMIHDLAAAPDIGDLAQAAANEVLDPWPAANVAQIERRWRRARAVPTALAIALAEASALCEQAWRQARADNDWQAVSGLLETLLGLKREQAQALADALGCSAYDALLDGYEPAYNERTSIPCSRNSAPRCRR